MVDSCKSYAHVLRKKERVIAIWKGLMLKLNLVVVKLAFNKSQCQTGFPSPHVSKKYLGRLAYVKTTGPSNLEGKGLKLVFDKELSPKF